MDIRRAVTGFDANGKAVITSDDRQRVEVTFPDVPGIEVTRIWATEGCPPELDGPDRTLESWTLQPPIGGVNWQIITRQPGVVASTSQASQNTDAIAPGTRPGMHRTDTLDFIIVLSGEITLFVDEQELTLGPLDTVIQRGTTHAWLNRGTVPCVMLATMISTER